MHDAKRLVARFITDRPPTYDLPDEIPFIHDAYRAKSPDLSETKMMKWLFERERSSKRDRCFFAVPVGSSEEEKRQYAAREYLARQALTYAIYGLGNCSDRVAYAAIVLSDVLGGLDLELRVYSILSRDQFLLLIGDKRAGVTWVYDPLIDPTCLFEKNDYQREILKPYYPKLPKQVYKHRTKVNFSVDTSLSEMFEVELADYFSSGVDFGKAEDIRTTLEFLLQADSEQHACLPSALEQLESIYQEQHESYIAGQFDKLALPLSMPCAKSVQLPEGDNVLQTYLKGELEFSAYKKEDDIVDLEADVSDDAAFEKSTQLATALPGSRYASSNGVLLFTLQGVNEDEKGNQITRYLSSAAKS